MFDLILNTWSLTQDHQEDVDPEVSTEEVRVLIKARSSVHQEGRPDLSNVDEDGLSSDNRGFNKELFHLIDFLRSETCLRQLRETKEDKKNLKRCRVPGGAVPAASAEQESSQMTE